MYKFLWNVGFSYSFLYVLSFLRREIFVFIVTILYCIENGYIYTWFKSTYSKKIRNIFHLELLLLYSSPKKSLRNSKKYLLLSGKFICKKVASSPPKSRRGGWIWMLYSDPCYIRIQRPQKQNIGRTRQ